MKIIFTNTSSFNLDLPKPALSVVPDWYKKTLPYLDIDKKNPTIKKCIPVFDAITSGYIIECPVDILIYIQDGVQKFKWTDFPVISYQPLEQAPLHPNSKDTPYPKWNNPWKISTPEGYSTLFVQPFHRDSIFTILPAIVDTDHYPQPVNFPFVVNDPNFEGVIKKGTPVVQVIPFKRDEWSTEFIADPIKKIDTDSINNSNKFKGTVPGAYKKLNWVKKRFQGSA